MFLRGKPWLSLQFEAGIFLSVFSCRAILEHFPKGSHNLFRYSIFSGKKSEKQTGCVSCWIATSGLVRQVDNMPGGNTPIQTICKQKGFPEFREALLFQYFILRSERYL